MKKIIAREIKDKKVAVIAYCAITLALALLYISLFPSVRNSAQQFQKLYESYPKGFYQAVGIEHLSISTLEGYLSVELFSIVWPIMSLMLSASLAGNTIAGQIERGYIGFYLALPMSRVKLFTAKYISGVVQCILFVAVSTFGIVPIAGLLNIDISIKSMANLSILSLLFMWSAYAMSLFFSALFSDRGKVYMAMGGILITMYALNIISSLKDSLKWLEHTSIFHFYNAQNVLEGKPIQTASVAVFSGIIIVFTTLGLFLFSRRDISV